MTVRALVVGLALALAVAMSAAAQTCSCRGLDRSELLKLDVVFEGTVDGEPTPLQSSVTVPQEAYIFNVGRVWKGDVGPSVRVVFSSPLGSDCSPHRKSGEYLRVGASLFRGQPTQSTPCILLSLAEWAGDLSSLFGPARPPKTTP